MEQPLPTLYITNEEVRVLNEARLLLERIRDRMPDSFNGGRTAAAADHAEWSVFRVQNYLKSYLHVPLTPDQLHPKQED